MKAWPAAIVGWACLAAAGCRTDPALTALERENFRLEETLYGLQDVLDKTQDALDQCRRENEGLRKGERTAPRLAPERPARGAPAAEAPPSPAVRGPELPALPRIELPSKALPPGEIPETFRGPGRPGTREKPAPPARSEDSEQAPPAFRKPEAAPDSRAIPPSSGEPRRLDVPLTNPKGISADEEPSENLPAAYREQLSAAVPVEPRGDSASARRIALNPALTGGFDAEPRPGDEGILVMIEPRDGQGKLLAAAAPTSVVVLDGALPGEAARLARWDLTAEDMATSYCRMPEGEGFCLALPWPAAPPVHSRLQLFVRYTTRDGRNLEASRPIDVAVPGQVAARRASGPILEEASAGPRSLWQQKPPDEKGEKPSGQTPQDAARLARDARPPDSPAAAEAPKAAARPTPAISDAASTPAPQSKTRPARPIWSPYRR